MSEPTVTPDDALPAPDDRRISRRTALRVLGAGAVAAAGFGGGLAFAHARADDGATDHDGHGFGDGAHAGSGRHAFLGDRQAGITTPMQEFLHFAALDVTADDRGRLADLLQRWSAAAEAMCAGRPVIADTVTSGSYDAPPDDTGEAIGLPAANLTITIGFGPSLFRTSDGRDRMGLAAQQPAPLQDLPPFPGDTIDPARSGGDLCIQACADNPQVAVHAVRNLVRMGFGTTTLRWSQTGFGRSSATTRGETTPRNLFGFKDGTANPRAEDGTVLDEHVWVAPGDGPDWLAGGTYLALRKIRMLIETWDRTTLREQEAVFGRTRLEGSPLSGGGEFAAPDFTAVDPDGAPLIDPASHVALAHPSHNGGARILRRAYNYTDGSDGLGRLDGGLFFIAFQRDVGRQFVPIQARLSAKDLMNEYVRYVANGVFAIPPGAREPGDWIGRALLT